MCCHVFLSCIHFHVKFVQLFSLYKLYKQAILHRLYVYINNINRLFFIGYNVNWLGNFQVVMMFCLENILLQKNLLHTPDVTYKCLVL